MRRPQFLEAMADVEDFNQIPETADADVDMRGEKNPGNIEEDTVGVEAGQDEGDAKVAFNPQTIFLDY